MKLNEVLKVLEEHGHPLTRASLYRAGLKNGFLSKVPYGKTTRYIIDNLKFRKWLDKATKDVPEGVVTLSEASEKFKVSYGTILNYIKNGEVQAHNYGAGKGITYVKLRDVEIAVTIHRQRN